MSVFDPSLPDGSARTGPQTVSDIRTNLLALRDSSAIGGMGGFDYSQSVGTGTAEEPQFVFLKSGVTWIRATITWSNGYPSPILYEISTDSGSSYATLGNTSSPVDSGFNPTATTGGGFSLVSVWLNALIVKFKALRTAFSTHIAGIGPAVHGLGSMSLQSAGAVSITGGNANLNNVSAHSFFGSLIVNGAATGTVPLTFNESGYVLTLAGNITITVANLPGSGFGQMVVEIYNPTGKTVTWPTANWGGGTAVAAGTWDVYTLYSRGGVLFIARGMANCAPV